jgi:hypothetical protein
MVPPISKYKIRCAEYCKKFRAQSIVKISAKGYAQNILKQREHVKTLSDSLIN